MVSCYRRSIHNFYLSSIIFWENDKELKHIENEYNDTSAGEQRPFEIGVIKGEAETK